MLKGTEGLTPVRVMVTAEREVQGYQGERYFAFPYEDGTELWGVESGDPSEVYSPYHCLLTATSRDEALRITRESSLFPRETA